MATVTHRVVTTDTGNTPNTSAAFSFASGDLLVVYVTKEASVSMASADLTCADVTGVSTFTMIRDETFWAGAACFAVFVADQLTTGAGAAGTVSIASGADPGAGSIIAVFTVAGMSRTGSSAVRQSGGLSDQAAAIPSINFATGVALTANACLGGIGTSDATPGLTPPASWSEGADTGYTTGDDCGIETVFRNSGHTSQTVAWQTVSLGADWGGIILELDISAPSVSHTDKPSGTIVLTGAVREQHRLPTIDRRSGQIDLSGTLGSTFTSIITRTDKPSGTISLLGTRRESLTHRDSVGAGGVGQTYSELVLSLNPLLYWRLGEAAGPTAEDASPNNRDGTYTGTTFSQTGALAGDSDTAVDLDGTDDRVTSSYDPFTNGTTRTFIGWASRDDTDGYHSLFGSTAGGYVSLLLNTGNQDVYFTPQNGTGWATWTGGWPGTGQWVFWGLVFNEATNAATLYINGSPVSTKSHSGQYVAGSFKVGADGAAANDAFDGKVDEVAVFDGDLGATNIAAIYALGHDGPTSVPGAIITLSGTVSEQNFTAVTYTEKVTGTITLSGASREQNSQRAKPTGTILLSGQASDQYAAIVTNTDSPAGQITFSGTLSDEFVGAITDSFTGQILLSGTVRESQSTSYRTSGQIILSGSVRESWALGYTDRRSGQIDLSGTVSEQYLLATVDRTTGTITLTGATRESSSQTSKGTGTIVLSGSLSDRYVGATTDFVTGQIILTGAIREQYLSATTDRVTGTITLSGATRESHAVSRTEKVIGTVQLSGTLTDSFQISGGTQTVTPTGTIILSGTRRESQSRSGRATGLVTISGTASDSWSLGYTDRVSGQISLAGAARESSSQTSKGTGSVVLSGTASDQYVGATTDLVTGQITLSGAIREQSTAATVDRASGVITLSGTWRESSSRRVLRTGTITVTGTVSERTIGATTDRRSGQITISGTQSDYWESTRTERRSGTIVISGQMWEDYIPSGVTIDERTGTIILSGSLLDIHSRWDFVDGERWPGSTEDRWQEDVGERWNLDPVA